MFKSLLTKIPFLRKHFKKKEVENRLSALESLLLIRDSFKEAVSYEEIFDSLKRILTNDVVELQTALIINKDTKVSFHSKTSNDALDLIDKSAFGTETLNRLTNQFSFEVSARPFMYWESNEESIIVFYSFMKDMVQKATLLYGTINDKYLDQNKVSEEEAVFINSILFRYLCFDLVTLLVFYLEESNEAAEQQNDS